LCFATAENHHIQEFATSHEQPFSTKLKHTQTRAKQQPKKQRINTDLKKSQVSMSNVSKSEIMRAVERRTEYQKTTPYNTA